MARSLRLPHKATNPRSVRGAVRRGWNTVEVSNWKHGVTWIGLNIWCEMNLNGYWVSSYESGVFAFEDGKDATVFALKWT